MVGRKLVGEEDGNADKILLTIGEGGQGGDNALPKRKLGRERCYRQDVGEENGGAGKGCRWVPSRHCQQQVSVGSDRRNSGKLGLVRVGWGYVFFGIRPDWPVHSNH